MTSHTRRQFNGILVALALGLSSGAPAAAKAGPPQVTLTRNAKDPRWLTGTVRIAAEPNRVFARVTEVNKWQALFSDVKSLKVVKHENQYWHVRLDTKTMDCGAHDYHIRFGANRRMELKIDAPGINANGLLRLDTDRQGSAVATFSLFIETTGLFGWFIPEKEVRKRQEAMVRSDLTDLAKAFAGGR